MNSARHEKCAESFEYFLYDLKTREGLATFAGKKVTPATFFSEEAYAAYFKFYSTFNTDEKLVLIKNQTRQIGYSTFLAFYSFYKCLYRPTRIFFITEPKHYRLFTETIQDISVMLKSICHQLVNINNGTKEITFERPGSSIRFLSDVTYEFNSYKGENIDYIFFDNASLSNYDKLSSLLDRAVSTSGINKVVMNFNYDKTQTLAERLVNEFKDKIKVINTLNVEK